MLSVASVEHRYGDRVALPLTTFTLAPGEHCALVGASGSGKTTLLHVLAGFLRPTQGEVMLAGENLYAPARSDQWRASRIGMVPQKLHLIGGLSALDNLRLAQTFSGRTDAAHVRALIERLGLQAVADRRPDELSLGQQQRLAVARAVIQRPRLLLADEPTSALDDGHAQRALDVLFDAAAAAETLLVVATHDARIRDRFARVIALPAA